MSSEVYSYLYEKLLDEGVLDVYTESIYMKKNRPANKLCVLCKEQDLDKFIEIILIETSSFGVRYNKYNREELNRTFKKVHTKYGEVTVKLGYYNNKLIKATPEYEECKYIAKQYGISINEVYFEINCIIKQKINSKLLT